MRNNYIKIVTVFLLMTLLLSFSVSNEVEARTFNNKTILLSKEEPKKEKKAADNKEKVPEKTDEEEKEVKDELKKPQEKVDIPSSVKNIVKENTYPNSTDHIPQLQPSELTEELLSNSNVKIENPNLIKMLNETGVNSTPFAIGYRAKIYLGKWPLNYESAETSPNWEYQKINTNYKDNRGSNSSIQLNYVQEGQKTVRGGLTAKISKADDVKKMMQLKAEQHTGLPLSFQTVVGGGTKLDQIYNIPAKRLGYLNAYAPAVNEKGQVTYGEVYIVLKGSKKMIDVKNVTTQGIGAWIPVQDHLSFSFFATEQPK